MKYKIKCKECGKLFHVDAHPNEKVKCKCPYCGKVMSCIMALPVVGARSIKQVTSRRMLKDSNGNPLPVVELYGNNIPSLSEPSNFKSENRNDKKGRVASLKRFLSWTWQHISVFFSWSSGRIRDFRDKYDDADIWLFIGFSLLFILIVVLGLFVFAEITKLIVSEQSWLFKTWTSIIY